jgi:pimeloyl-ACP methyl ester carboxylesterase/class 3 adenylate cyclase
MEAPETRYVDSGGVQIAYQVIGNGPRDLVVVPGFVSNLDMQWADAAITRFNEQLASFSRLVMYDKAGTGLSDPVSAVPTLEQRMEDLHAVLDAAGAERPVLLGISEGGPMSLLFAATYPERVSGLILYGTIAAGLLDPLENPGGPRWVDWFSRVQTAVEHWGEGLIVDVFSPTLAGQPSARRIVGVNERAMASPAMARATWEAIAPIDVREVLPTISTPTLVLHRIGDGIPIDGARYIAERVPAARIVELPGADHWWWIGDSSAILEAIEEFLTGVRPERTTDRMLATVLFTDIVGSTERAAEVGDSAWRALLERHNEVTREQLDVFRGREIASTGDGFLATFDGPARGVRCARAIADSLQRVGVEVRAGLHTGECEELGENIGGIAVHIGARVAAAASPGEVLVSSTVRDLVAGSGIEFEDAGERELKGVPGSWQLCRVVGVPREDGGAREPLPTGVAPLIHQRPPLSQRFMIAAARRAPGISRRVGGRLYRRAESERVPEHLSG